MKKNHAKTYIIVAILISIVGISIAYAALSQQLQIKTTTTVQSSQTSWNIVFERVHCIIDGNAVLGTFETKGTTITVSGFTLNKPDDYFDCFITVANKGEINAKISSINYKEPTFSGTGTNATSDSTLVKNNLWRVFRWNDTKIDIKTEDLLPAKGEKQIEMAFGMQESMTTLPTNPVTFTNATYTINFEQT